MADPQRYLPLTPRFFHILLALAESPKNGYQISAAVSANSRDVVRLSPATQYENLHRLYDRGLVEEVADRRDCPADGRGQRYWQLTSLGTAVLRAEMRRLSDDLAFARGLPRLRKTLP